MIPREIFLHRDRAAALDLACLVSQAEPALPQNAVDAVAVSEHGATGECLPIFHSPPVTQRVQCPPHDRPT